MQCLINFSLVILLSRDQLLPTWSRVCLVCLINYRKKLFACHLSMILTSSLCKRPRGNFTPDFSRKLFACPCHPAMRGEHVPFSVEHTEIETLATYKTGKTMFSISWIKYVGAPVINCTLDNRKVISGGRTRPEENAQSTIYYISERATFDLQSFNWIWLRFLRATFNRNYSLANVSYRTWRSWCDPISSDADLTSTCQIYSVDWLRLLRHCM